MKSIDDLIAALAGLLVFGIGGLIYSCVGALIRKRRERNRKQ